MDAAFIRDLALLVIGALILPGVPVLIWMWARLQQVQTKSEVLELLREREQERDDRLDKRLDKMEAGIRSEIAAQSEAAKADRDRLERLLKNGHGRRRWLGR